MTDISKLSDAELTSLYQQQSTPSLSAISDTDLKALYDKQNVLTGMDVAKQIGSGLVTGVEAIPAAVPSLLGMAGRGVDWMMGGTEAGNKQAELRNLISTQRNGGLSQYLPKPETTAGEFARTGTEFIPSMLGMPGSLLKNAVIGGASGLASEGAGQIPGIKGTAAEGPARLTGALLGGPAAAKTAEIPATRAAAKAAITAEDLNAAAQQQYKEVHALGLELKPQPMANLAHQIENTLTSEGYTARNAAPVYEAIGTLKNPPSGAAITSHNFDNLRKEMVAATQSSEGSVRNAAKTTIKELDNYLANLPASHVLKGNAQEASALFKEARGNWAAMKRMEMVGGKLDLAELNAATAHSGQNIDNATRQAIKQLIRPDKYGKSMAQKSGFNADEIAQMQKIARGSSVGNITRAIGNMAGGGLGIGVPIVAGTAAYHYGPEAGLVPLAGFGLKKFGNALTSRKAEQLSQMTAARSPLGGGILSIPPRSRTYPAPALLPLTLGR